MPVTTCPRCAQPYDPETRDSACPHDKHQPLFASDGLVVADPPDGDGKKRVVNPNYCEG